MVRSISEWRCLAAMCRYRATVFAVEFAGSLLFGDVALQRTAEGQTAILFLSGSAPGSVGILALIQALQCLDCFRVRLGDGDLASNAQLDTDALTPSPSAGSRKTRTLR